MPAHLSRWLFTAIVLLEVTWSSRAADPLPKRTSQMRVIKKPTLPDHVSDWHAFPEQVDREARTFNLPQIIMSHSDHSQKTPLRRPDGECCWLSHQYCGDLWITGHETSVHESFDKRFRVFECREFPFSAIQLKSSLRYLGQIDTKTVHQPRCG